jgi:hypothetical protein
MSYKEQKGQVSIEILILLAILIISAIVLTVVLINAYNKNIEQTDDISSQKDGIVDTFVDDLNSYNENNTGGSGTTPPVPDLFDAWIDSPFNNSEHIRDQDIDFIADYENQDGAVNCEWLYKTSSMADFLGFKDGSCNFQYSFHDLEDYEIKLIATDNSQNIVDIITIEIKNNNPLNFVTIINPTSGTSYNIGEQVDLEAEINSPGAPIKDCYWTYQKIVTVGPPGNIVTFYDSDCSLNVTLLTDSLEAGEDYEITFYATGVVNDEEKSDSIDIHLLAPFSATLEEPSTDEYILGNFVDFIVNYDNNITPVTCSWNVVNDQEPPTVYNFTECNVTERMDNAGSYEFNVDVFHNSSATNFAGNFQVVN